MQQDRLLEPLQRLTRIEAELFDERRPRVLVRRERIGLPARRGTAPGSAAPADRSRKRMLPHERLQLRHHLVRTAAAPDPLPVADRARPVAAPPAARSRHDANGSYCTSASAGPRHSPSAAPQHLGRRLRRPLCEQRPPLARADPRSGRGRARPTSTPRHVAGRPRARSRRRQVAFRSCETVDAAQALHRGRRRPLAPQLVDQSRRRHRLVRAQQQASASTCPPLRRAELEPRDRPSTPRADPEAPNSIRRT